MCARVINGYGQVLHTVIVKNGYVMEKGFIGRAETALWSCGGVALLYIFISIEL